MEPVITTQLIEKLGAFGVKAGIKEAIDFVKHKRMQYFLVQLQEELEKEATAGSETSKPDELLKKLLSDETGKEILFDSYKRVSLSASKELGPRIIALLTLKLLKENRFANEDEDRMFNGAETLKDVELRWFATNFPNDNGQKPVLQFHAAQALKLRGNQVALKTVKPREDFPFVIYKLQFAHIMQVEELGPHDEPQKRQKVAYTSTTMKEFVDLINRATGPQT